VNRRHLDVETFSNLARVMKECRSEVHWSSRVDSDTFLLGFGIGFYGTVVVRRFLQGVAPFGQQINCAFDEPLRVFALLSWKAYHTL